MKRILTVVLLAAGLAACSDSTGSDGPRLSELSISPTLVYTAVNDTAQLSVEAVDTEGDDVANPDVDFESSNTSVARVDDDGVVTGVSVGSTTITARAGGATDQVTVNVVAAGSLLSLNVNSDQGCTNAIIRKARIVATSTRAIIVEDVNNPPGGFTNAEYQEIANKFDALVYPTDVANFGAPGDIDNNGGRSIIFYTRAVNELTPRGSSFYVGGFFYARDLFPRTATARQGACPASNVAEIFYMLAVDPNGEVNGNARGKAFVRNVTVGTLAHEFQHLINSSRRLLINNNAKWPETVWMDEGLSHIAEELSFFVDAGLQPRQNLGAPQVATPAARFDSFDEFAYPNFARYEEYLQSPELTSPIANNDDLGTRGATWNFLRYAADRRGGSEQTFWFNLVNQPDTGYTNLQVALAADPQLYFRDWTVSHYADDVVPGAPTRFQQPTWNLRSIFSLNVLGGSYPLRVRTLTAGATANTAIRSSTAAYFRFAVPAGGTGDIRVSQQGTTEAGACTPVNLGVGEAYQGGSTPSALCFAAGEYVLIPYYASTSQTGSSEVNISVVGTGITPPVGPPNPSLSPVLAPPSFDRILSEAALKRDVVFHRRLRESERSELTALVRGGGFTGPRREVSAAPAPADVRIQVLRIK
jgi:hypothetical protein